MKYPIGIQDFESLRKDGYVYVDKTALIHGLVNHGLQNILVRPPHFGKSLLLSTIKAYCEGKRELFSGLAIEGLEKEWIKRPVLLLDLSRGTYDTEEALDDALDSTLSEWESVYGSEPTEVGIQLRFGGIIRRACEQTGQKVVILIDEYDKPCRDACADEELCEKFRRKLMAFFTVLKPAGKYIHFSLLTGVVPIRLTDWLSGGANNLIDISTHYKYVDLCGITEAELHSCFDESIRELAGHRGMTYEEACAKLREQYDGYHFVDGGVGMYNPSSVLNTLAKRKFDSYWFKTGTPSFLLRMLRDKDYDLRDLDGAQASSDMLEGVESFKSSPVAILYQSGYLTIKGYDPELNEYSLCFPNREVEEGFTNVTAMLEC